MKQLNGSYNLNVKKNPFSSILVKFVICFLLLGLAYRLYSSSYVQFSPVEVTTETTTTINGDDDVGPQSLPPPVISGLPPVSTIDPPPEAVDVNKNTTSQAG